MSIVSISIGDFYGDGHGKYARRFYESNYELGKIKELYRLASEKTGINLKNISRGYEEYFITKEKHDQIVELGFCFEEFEEDINDFEEDEFGFIKNMESNLFFHLIFFLIKQVDDNFEIEEINIPTWHTGFGYGCFPD